MVTLAGPDGTNPVKPDAVTAVGALGTVIVADIVKALLPDGGDCDKR